MNEKALRAGCASRGVEVSCKQHRSSAKESQATLCFFRDSGIRKDRHFMILKWRLFLFTRVMSQADMLAYLFGEYRDNEITITSRNNSNNQK